jgi:hypothetical protein
MIVNCLVHIHCWFTSLLSGVEKCYYDVAPDGDVAKDCHVEYYENFIISCHTVYTVNCCFPSHNPRYYCFAQLFYYVMLSRIK